MTDTEKEKPASEAGDSTQINNAKTARCLSEDSHNETQNASTQSGIATSSRGLVVISEAGWIKLHRSITEWGWINKPGYLRLWVELLVRANHSEREFEGVTVRRGQCIVGLISLHESTDLSIRNVRTILKNLEKSGEISIKPTSKFSIITINKYCEYQDSNGTDRQTTDKQLTNDRQTTDKRPTTNKNDQELKNERKKEDLSVAVSAPAQQLTIATPPPAEPLKAKPAPKQQRHRHGPEGSQWFLCTDEQYAAKVKERGKAWVEYWVLKFCVWAGGENPAASARIKDHFLEVEGWESREEDAGRTWYEPAGCYLTGDQYLEAERKANALDQGLKALVKEKGK